MTIATDFSGNAQEDQFSSVQFSLSDNSVPVISGTLGVIHGETLGLHDVGDHYLWLGKVSAVEEGLRVPSFSVIPESVSPLCSPPAGLRGDPLVYHGQTYKSIGDEVLIQEFEEQTLKFENWTHRVWDPLRFRDSVSVPNTDRLPRPTFELPGITSAITEKMWPHP